MPTDPHFELLTDDIIHAAEAYASRIGKDDADRRAILLGFYQGAVYVYEQQLQLRRQEAREFANWIDGAKK